MDFRRFRNVACGLQRLPHAFHEDPVLWIGDASFSGRKPEELGVEKLNVVQVVSGPNVIGMIKNVGTEACSRTILVFGRPDGINSGRQIVPEFGDVPGHREAAAHADDGDAGGPAFMLDRFPSLLHWTRSEEVEVEKTGA